MDRVSGPYTAEPFVFFGPLDADVLDPNQPPEGQPDLYCQWVSTSTGEEIVWNHDSKFPFAAKWLEYVIGQFLAPGARLSDELAVSPPGRYHAPELANFTFDHVLNGVIYVDAVGSEQWRIVVEDNRVSEQFDLPPGE